MPKAEKKNVDVNPQYINFTVTESAANTFTEKEIQLPIPRMGDFKMVVEILKIWFDVAIDILADDGQSSYQVCFNSQTAIQALGSSNVLMRGRCETQMVTSGAIVNLWPQELDLTDGNGNGVLVAVDKLFFAVQGSSQGNALSFTGKLLYRFKRISTEEYIGIVQSQMAS